MATGPSHSEQSHSASFQSKAGSICSVTNLARLSAGTSLTVNVVLLFVELLKRRDEFAGATYELVFGVKQRKPSQCRHINAIFVMIVILSRESALSAAL